MEDELVAVYRANAADYPHTHTHKHRRRVARRKKRWLVEAVAMEMR